MRISKRDRQEYDRLTKALLNKADRVKKQHNINFLSENPDLKMKPLENMTRNEFNTYKEQARLMTKRGIQRFSYVKINDYVSVSRSEERRLRYNKEIADRQAKRRYDELKDKDYYEEGQEPSKVGVYVETMKEPDIPGINAPHVLDDDKIASREYVRNKIKQLDNFSNLSIRNERNEIMKQNYIKGLEEVFNGGGDELDELIQQIENIETDDFIELYSRSADMSFTYFYVDDYILLRENFNNIQSYINSYYQGDVDMDIKNARDNINTNVK